MENPYVGLSMCVGFVLGLPALHRFTLFQMVCDGVFENKIINADPTASISGTMKPCMICCTLLLLCYYVRTCSSVPDDAECVGILGFRPKQLLHV